METKKIFTLAEARKELPRVKELTDKCRDEVESFREEMDSEEDEQKRGALQARAENLLEAWSRSIMELGAEPKGLWLVDFDSGDGFYFCWHHGEDEIEFIHGYESGYGGRRKIHWN